MTTYFTPIQKQIEIMKEKENKPSIRPSIVVGEGTVWTRTLLLRWKDKVVSCISSSGDEVLRMEKTLQQMWQDEGGNQEWRDIEYQNDINVV